MKLSFAVLTIVPATLLGLAFAPVHILGDSGVAGEATDETPPRIAQEESDPATEPAHDHDHGEPTTQPDVALTATPQHFGAPFTLEGEPLSLSDAVASCLDTGEPCKAQGVVDAVCQRRGCWFTLVPAPAETGEPAGQLDRLVRVRMQDYGFFVPMTSAGAVAVVEGALTLESLSQEQAAHYAEEAGGDAESVSGPQEIYEFMITGVDLSRPE